MSNEFKIGHDSGATILATPYLNGITQPPITMTELGTTRIYVGDMAGAAGRYIIVFTMDGVTLGYGDMDWDGVQEVATQVRAELATELAAIGGIPSAADNAEAVMTHASAAELISNTTFAKDIEGGKWEIDGTQMIFYKEDNTTEIARYNLFDINGNPSATDVYKRERVI